MSSGEESLSAVAAVVRDNRVWDLVDALSPTVGLPRVVRHAEEVLTRSQAAGAGQGRRILDAWRAQCAATWPGDGMVRELDLLVRSVATWDLRRGAERDAIPAEADLLPGDIADCVMALADDWGLTAEDDDVRGHFDIVAPIGGLIRANVGRPATAAALLAEGSITAGAVVGLAGERKMSEAELAIARDIGIAVETEQDALRIGFERAFALSPESWRTADGTSRLLVAAGSAPVEVMLSITPVDPVTGRRATTGEVVTEVLRSGRFPTQGSILQITSSIYRVANHVAFRTSVPRELRVQTIGARAGLQPGPSQILRPQHYLQELKAAIDSMPVLEKWARAAPHLA